MCCGGNSPTPRLVLGQGATISHLPGAAAAFVQPSLRMSLA